MAQKIKEIEPYFTDLAPVLHIQKVLYDWYQYNGIDYPWRREPLDVYRIIITECLLQRTCAETVAKHWGKFFRVVPDWEALVSIDIEVLADLIRPFGLINYRLQIFHELAWEMIERKGVLPNEELVLEELPGVGQYIANAVRLLVFDERTPLLDGKRMPNSIYKT